MKLILGMAVLLLSCVPAGAQEDGEQIPMPDTPAPPAGFSTQAAPAKKKPVSLSFCDTIDGKLKACRATDPKKLKKISFPPVDTAAVKQKRQDARAKIAKAREFCRIVKAQRAKADELRLKGGENSAAASGNLYRQANLIENTAEVLLNEALQLLKEIGECPSWQPPASGKKRARA